MLLGRNGSYTMPWGSDCTEMLLELSEQLSEVHLGLLAFHMLSDKLLASSKGSIGSENFLL